MLLVLLNILIGSPSFAAFIVIEPRTECINATAALGDYAVYMGMKGDHVQLVSKENHAVSQIRVFSERGSADVNGLSCEMSREPYGQTFNVLTRAVTDRARAMENKSLGPLTDVQKEKLRNCLHADTEKDQRFSELRIAVQSLLGRAPSSSTQPAPAEGQP